MLMCVWEAYLTWCEDKYRPMLYCKRLIMQAVVENHRPLINFDEKAETPSNNSVVMCRSQCGQAIFTLRKLHFYWWHFLVIITLFLHDCQKSRHLLAGPLPARSVAIIVVRKQMWVHTLERKSVCDCGHVRLHGMAVCECDVCACAGCGRVGFGKYDLAFPTPGFCPGLRVKCTAMSGHTALPHHTHTHTHTHTPTVHERGGSARERSCVTVRWPWSAVVKPRELGGKWLHVVWHLISLLNWRKDTCTQDQMCRDIRLSAPSE